MPASISALTFLQELRVSGVHAHPARQLLLCMHVSRTHSTRNVWKSRSGRDYPRVPNSVNVDVHGDRSDGYGRVHGEAKNQNQAILLSLFFFSIIIDPSFLLDN